MSTMSLTQVIMNQTDEHTSPRQVRHHGYEIFRVHIYAGEKTCIHRYPNMISVEALDWNVSL